MQHSADSKALLNEESFIHIVSGIPPSSVGQSMISLLVAIPIWSCLLSSSMFTLTDLLKRLTRPFAALIVWAIIWTLSNEPLIASCNAWPKHLTSVLLFGKRAAHETIFDALSETRDVILSSLMALSLQILLISANTFSPVCLSVVFPVAST